MKIKDGYWVATAEEIAEHGCIIVEDNGLILGNTHILKVVFTSLFQKMKMVKCLFGPEK